VTSELEHLGFGAAPVEGGPGPLHGIRVVELASQHAAFAGKLFADLGADVVVVEPPGGHSSRSIGPFLDDEPGPERSLWWWHYNTSKKSIALDFGRAPDGRVLTQLLGGADVVLEAELPGSLEERGIDRAEIMAERPELIWVSVSPFGQRGPRAGDPVTDLTLMAGSGPVWNCGYDDHSLPPVRGGGNQAAHVSSIHAVLSALTALIYRDSSGTGQHIDVNMHAALNVTTEVATNEWLVAGHTVQRQTGRHAQVSPTSATQVRAADGRYVVLGFPPRAAEDYQAIVDWLEELELGSVFPDTVLLQMGVDRGGVKIVELGQDPIADQIWNAGRDAMVVIASHLGAYECFEGFQKRGIVCGILYPPEEVLHDEHFRARGFPVPVVHKDVNRTFEYPGAPVVFKRSPWRIASRAPEVDEHRSEVLGLLAGD
jgi:crotonobetainyl-CoA:carnitine CoA-transferase CaiB-like acyl-CoA transferase